MPQAHEPANSPFSAGLIPAGFDDLFLHTADDANGNRDSTGYTVGTGGTITASPNATYTYDAAGHLTARTDTSTGKVTTFAYDHRDRLVGITRKTSGGTVDYRTTYVYDALNRRIAGRVDADGAGAGSPVTTWTVFDGQNPYADFDGAGSLAQRYLHGAAVDALLARSDASGVTDWYLTDRLGSVRDIVDTSGTVLYHTGYDSFGNKVSTTGSGGDRFGFTGREHDAALNLYYYRARFYDPATGRFVSKDPIGFNAGDANLYRYVGNGPTNGTDPSGTYNERIPGITDIFPNFVWPTPDDIVEYGIGWGSDEIIKRWTSEINAERNMVTNPLNYINHVNLLPKLSNKPSDLANFQFFEHYMSTTIMDRFKSQLSALEISQSMTIYRQESAKLALKIKASTNSVSFGTEYMDRINDRVPILINSEIRYLGDGSIGFGGYITIKVPVIPGSTISGGVVYESPGAGGPGQISGGIIGSIPIGGPPKRIPGGTKVNPGNNKPGHDISELIKGIIGIH